MGLLVPAFLVLLALCALVLALHVKRRRMLVVSSVQLWRMLEGQGGSRRSAWQKPQLTPLLFLQLAAVALLAAALAQPFLLRSGPPEHWILVLDATASMQARDAPPSRFAAAVNHIEDMLASSDHGAVPRISLVSAGIHTQLIAARLENRLGALKPRFRSLAPSSGEADWRRTATIIQGLAAPGEATRIVFLTDGNDEARDVLVSAIPDAAYSEARFGGPVPNVGIRASLAANGDVEGKEEGASFVLEGEVLFAGGAGGVPMTVYYTAEGNGEPLVWTTLDIAPPDADREPRNAGAQPDQPPAGLEPQVQSVPFSIDLELPRSGLVTVRLPEDYALYDNAAHFRVHEAPSTLDVLYVGAGNQPLLRALQSIQGVVVFEAGGLPKDISRFKLVVVDGVEIDRKPETNVVWIGSARVRGEAMPAQFTPGPVSYWERAAPLAEGVDLGALVVETAYDPQPSEGWDVLLEAGSSPLVMTRTMRDGRELRLLFDPTRSNWPEEIDFPVFAANLVDWLGPAPGVMVEQPCVVGAPCHIEAEWIGARISNEAGEDAPLSALPEKEGALVLDDGSGVFVPSDPGLYTIALGDKTRLVPVNAPAGAETNLGAVAEPLPPEDRFGFHNPIRFAPWLLILVIVVLLAEAWIAGRGPERFLHRSALARSNPLATRRRIILCLRLSTLVFVVLALLNVPILLRTASQNIVAIALPPSLPEHEVGNQALFERLDREVGAEHRSGAVSLGANPGFLGDLGEPRRDEPHSSDAANVEAALDLAAAALPADEPGRVLLLAPRGETIGDHAVAVSRLRMRNIPVDVLASTRSGQEEVALIEIGAPARLYAGDSFLLTGTAYSAGAASALLTISRDGQSLAEQKVDLLPGYNRIQTIIAAATEGRAFFKMELTGAADQIAFNNSQGLHVPVGRPARALIITPQVPQGEILADLLAAQNIDATILQSRRVPWRLSAFLDYDAIILANVPAIDLDTRQQNLIEEAVSHHGRGLLILGGENSFGPGGYLETPLERLSPLSSKVPREAPEAALAFVLDRSGSMGQKAGEVTRLDIAKQATLSATSLLGEKSQVSVVVFDSEASVVVPIQSALNQDVIASALANVDPGGGTAIVPGLREGLRQLQGVEAPARHIVLMTDGLSELGDLDSVVTQIAAEQITVSTVAIGEGADIGPLQRIAGEGGGSFHATTDFQALPSILSQEAMLLSGSPIEEGVTQPRWRRSDASFVEGMTGGLPPITGFVLTTAKPEAELSLVVPDQTGEIMPLLASWRYGNGHVMALTTHGAGSWSRQWLDAPAYSQLLAQVVRHFLPGSQTSGLVLALNRQGDEVRVRIDALDEDGALRSLPAFAATVVPPAAPGTQDQAEVPLALDEVAPGRYEGVFEASRMGDYLVRAAGGEEEAEALFHVAYGAGFAPDEQEDGFAWLAEATGGRVLAQADPLVPPSVWRWAQHSAWPLWAILALAILLAELTLRYAQIPWRRRG